MLYVQSVVQQDLEVLLDWSECIQMYVSCWQFYTNGIYLPQSKGWPTLFSWFYIFSMSNHTPEKKIQIWFTSLYGIEYTFCK